MQDKRDKYIIVNYNGMLHERGNEILGTLITHKLKESKDKTVKTVLVSLKSVIYKDNVTSVTMMIKYLDKLHHKLGVSISLIDYGMDMYQILQKVTKKSKVRLFKNITAANLFLDPKTFKQGLRVLVYDKDEANSIQLSKELSLYDYDVVRAKSLEEFQERMNDTSDHDIIITHSSLNMDFSGTKASSNTLALSKKLIMNLPVFMDTAVETLVNFTGLKAEKSSHGIKRFDTNLNSDIICAVMSFEGDIDGFFTLVFPRDIAVLTMESLLGEKVEVDDTETLMDGVGEFCNIITGSIKTVFTTKDIKMIFNLPKTYTSLQETDGFIPHNNGIWIDMQLAGKPFYMFITK